MEDDDFNEDNFAIGFEDDGGAQQPNLSGVGHSVNFTEVLIT